MHDKFDKGNYDYIPEELTDYFDGEINILILNPNYGGKGIGKKSFYRYLNMLEIFLRKDLEEKIMNNIEIKQITKIDNDTLDIITKWMYNWWGKEDGYVFEEVKCFMKHSLQQNRLPQTYGIFVDSKIVGMYQFAYEDISIRPDIYPWLANVYIDEAYRNKGLCRKMMETVKENAKKNLDFNEIYLYTKHQGLYEKFGWKYVSDFDTYRKSPRIQGLYKLELS